MDGIHQRFERHSEVNCEVVNERWKGNISSDPHTQAEYVMCVCLCVCLHRGKVGVKNQCYVIHCCKVEDVVCCVCVFR